MIRYTSRLTEGRAWILRVYVRSMNGTYVITVMNARPPVNRKIEGKTIRFAPAPTITSIGDIQRTAIARNWTNT